ncbi:type II toxin-antitoxin system VapC family toxin [Methylobacterium haplocladii]|uniref:Ribonuclease VapC n=1 Tax=Methylobacterium haplocladii TaxID=1176176 RepID=A0A512ILY4_9HYPH|nr:type II toxin-antitoxin system VapC family toxin [Methylobacterium haplocladii]GEO98733.1 ribonuclease VapC [Methylobacterium haplocladii]GJD85819.1 Ribonuclease VapC42 [Methylobacterium haplocladii]GLS57617.1 ribonuclease VapC [Methylobacterium haplocladii]
MFIDASALVAILCAETGYVTLADHLRSSGRPITSAFAIFETVMALSRKNGLSVEDGETEVRRFLVSAGIAIVAIADDESQAALAAHARFGKGRGHPAQLNMGDCFAYACARTHDVPLLFVGDDFPRTDIRLATV